MFKEGFIHSIESQRIQKRSRVACFLDEIERDRRTAFFASEKQQLKHMITSSQTIKLSKTKINEKEKEEAKERKIELLKY